MKTFFTVEINNLKHNYSYATCAHTTYEGAKKHCEKFNIDFTINQLDMIARVKELPIIED